MPNPSAATQQRDADITAICQLALDLPVLQGYYHAEDPARRTLVVQITPLIVGL